MKEKHSVKSHNALVTGATGYIGSMVVKRLLADGWNVHIIARENSSLALLPAQAASLTIHRHEGTTASLFAIVQQAEPELVFHLASLATATYVPEQIAPMLHSNIVFGTQLLEAMAAHRVYRLINTGTFSQHYGNQSYSPKSLYDASKQAFKDILSYYSESTPLRAITLELYDNYGPGDPRSKIVSLLLKAAKEQQTLAMSPGEQLIELVHIDDVVEAYVLAAHRLLDHDSVKDETYAVASGKPVSLKKLAALIESIVGLPLQIDWGGRPYHPREIMVPWNKGRQLPNWRPTITLEEGIRRLKDE
jgi:nucleoside-diphosphate-sugar epimerase